MPDYDYSQPGAYFVTICTKDRRCILSWITVGADALGGPELRLTAAGKITEKYILTTERISGLSVDKYVIMPNHIHLLLCVSQDKGPPRASAPTNALIPRAIAVMKHLVNKELKENIWQRSYYEHIIRDERDYLNILRYIDENPAKWAEDNYYIDT